MYEHGQSPDQIPTFTHNTIPAEGYQLGAEQTVELYPDRHRSHPDGDLRHPGGLISPYHHVGQVRIGDNETYEDLDIAFTPGFGRDADVAGLIRTSADGQKTWTAIGVGLSVGRDSKAEGLQGLPDTVSRNHFRISHDLQSGSLRITNQNPTNATTLLPPREIEASPKKRSTPPQPYLTYVWEITEPAKDVASDAGSKALQLAEVTDPARDTPVRKSEPSRRRRIQPAYYAQRNPRARR